MEHVVLILVLSIIFTSVKSTENCPNFWKAIKAFPKSATKLALDRKDIKCIPCNGFHGYDNVTKLSLYKNKISEIPEGVFDTLTKLNELYLSDNKIKAIPEKSFQALTNLTILHMYENKISVLPVKVFATLKNLVVLSMWANNIQGLPPHVFDGLKSLRALHLPYNEIKIVPENVFDNMTDLRELYIEENEIKDLPVNVFDGMKKLKSVCVHSNQLTKCAKVKLLKYEKLLRKNSYCWSLTYLASCETKSLCEIVATPDAKLKPSIHLKEIEAAIKIGRLEYETDFMAIAISLERIINAKSFSWNNPIWHNIFNIYWKLKKEVKPTYGFRCAEKELMSTLKKTIVAKGPTAYCYQASYCAIKEEYEPFCKSKCYCKSADFEKSPCTDIMNPGTNLGQEENVKDSA